MKRSKKLGLTKGPEFVFIEPWDITREFIFKTSIEMFKYFVGICVVLGVIGLLLFQHGLKQRRTSAAFMATLSPAERAQVHQEIAQFKRKHMMRSLKWGAVVAVIFGIAYFN